MRTRARLLADCSPKHEPLVPILTRARPRPRTLTRSRIITSPLTRSPASPLTLTPVPKPRAVARSPARSLVTVTSCRSSLFTASKVGVKDYVGVDPEAAVRDFRERIEKYERVYEVRPSHVTPYVGPHEPT
eukprot:1290377-Prymnesium_polylepis.3